MVCMFEADLVAMQVGSLRMVLSLEELGPAVEIATHQGTVDTATAAASAAAQPKASLGAAASPNQTAPAGSSIGIGPGSTARAATASEELNSAAGKAEKVSVYSHTVFCAATKQLAVCIPECVLLTSTVPKLTTIHCMARLRPQIAANTLMPGCSCIEYNAKIVPIIHQQGLKEQLTSVLAAIIHWVGRHR